MPTIREADGLAMSSRNRRLNEDQRKQAPLIFKALKILAEIKTGISYEEARENALALLEGNGFRVDYLEMANANDLMPAYGNDPQQQVALGAAYLGDIRLIDNLIL